MDLSIRPWSLNTFALTKVWFKCHTVDLRVSDISSVKSWLFQDQIEKPEEMIFFRPIQFGGLGLHSVKYKALASLIRTLMETAVNPSFKQNHFQTLLYRTYVLEDDSIIWPPPMPPYNSVAFFSSIKSPSPSQQLSGTEYCLRRRSPWSRGMTAAWGTSCQELSLPVLAQIGSKWQGGELVSN